MIHLSSASCEFCGQKLTVHEQAAGTTCSAPNCKQAYLKRLLKNRHRRAEVMERRLQAHRAKFADMLEPSHSVTIAALPCNNRPLERLPDARMQLFREHLRTVVATELPGMAGDARMSIQSGEKHTNLPDDGPGSGDAGESTDDTVHRNACTLCRGRCCSRMCNAYLCKRLYALKLDWDDKGTGLVLGVATDENDELVRTALISPQYKEL